MVTPGGRSSASSTSPGPGHGRHRPGGDEGWLRWGDGATGPFNDQPHTWEHALFDMAALRLS
jgi:hypothetical protein